MNKHNILTGLLRTSTLTIALGSSALVGCGNSDSDMVDARATISKVGQALFQVGDVQLLRGKYYSCRTHTDGTSWSIASGVSAQSDQVQVVKGNSACQLKLDKITIVRNSAPTDFAASSAFVIGQSYQTEAMLFSASSETFYGNVMLSDATYAAAFDVSMLFASDPDSVSQGASASYAKASAASVSVDGVPTPDYTFENNSLSIAVRDNFVLDGDATGGIKLDHGSVQGQQYILTQTDPGSTVSDLNQSWVTNVASAKNITADSDLSFAAAADLGLLDTSSLATDLVWYVLIANWDTSSSGTRSYQKFTITISHP